MSASLKGTPITAADCDAEWIATRREIIARSGYAVRARGVGSIEIKSLTPVEHLASHDRLRVNQWLPLMLPNEASCFATAAERDAVLQQLLSAS